MQIRHNGIIHSQMSKVNLDGMITAHFGRNKIAAITLIGKVLQRNCEYLSTTGEGIGFLSKKVSIFAESMSAPMMGLV